MLKLALDENFHGEVYDRLRLQLPSLDIIRIQDTQIVSADDDTMLAWVAQEGRLLVSHDESTLPVHFYARLNEGKPVSGVFMVVDDANLKAVTEDLVDIVQMTSYEEWVGRITYLPLR